MDDKILNKEEIENEIETAIMERREVNFAGKRLEFLSLAEKNVDYGINLQDSIIQGNVFLADTVINGNINLSNATVVGSFFGRGKLMGDFIMPKAKISHTMNLVGINITGSISCREAKITGFMSLTKAVILGDVDCYGLETRDFKKDELIIKGDVYLKSAQINGFFNLEEALVWGMVNLENALIRKSFSLKNASVQEMIILKNSTVINGCDFTGIPESKIIK